MSIVTLTDTAKAQIDSICQENDSYAVSLNLKGGGCAGFEYDWTIVATEADLEENDIVIDSDTGKFVVGAIAVMYMVGTEIDYVKDIMGATFQVNNPNAQSACGCGVSINFDVENLDNSLATAI
jgi:iron-sulfur cluster assembly accessory protein|tara:strand:- start:60 stop:431 length:372 start_codon:yes stop_codon:yes gene_type:complete